MWNDRFLNPCSIYARAAFDPITATIATVAGAAISAGSTLMGGAAAADAGNAQALAQRQGAADNAAALEFKATQEDQAAQESRAAAQRQALEKTHNARLLLSTLQARAAASGAGAADPGVQTIAGRIAGRGAYEALTDTYNGDNRALGLIDQAKGDRFSAATGIQGGNMAADASIAAGNARRSASYLSAAGTLIGGAGSAFKTYTGNNGYTARPTNGYY